MKNKHDAESRLYEEFDIDWLLLFNYYYYLMDGLLKFIAYTTSQGPDGLEVLWKRIIALICV